MYGPALAAIHDRWFAQLARGAAGHLAARASAPPDAVIDLGCGSGVLLERFHRPGTAGWGFDISPDMIAICRKRLPRFRFEVADALDAPLRPAAVIAAVGEVLSYATADSDDPDARLAASFARVAAHLRPGGVLLFDVLGDGHDYDYETRREEPDYTLSMGSRRIGDIVERTIRFSLHVGAGGASGDATAAPATEVHRLRVFRPEAIEAALASAGLHSRRLDGYAGVPLPPGRVGFECGVAG